VDGSPQPSLHELAQSVGRECIGITAYSRSIGLECRPPLRCVDAEVGGLTRECGVGRLRDERLDEWSVWSGTSSHGRCASLR